MRALVLVTSGDPGGAELRMAAVVRGLTERGWDVAYASVKPRGAVQDELVREGIPVHALDVRSARDVPRAVLRLRRIVRSRRPAVLHTALWHANALGRVAVLGLGLPVVNGHASIDDRKPRRRVLVDRLTHGLADRHVAVAEAVAERVATRDRVPRSRIVVVPQGKDGSLWAPRQRRTQARAALGLPPDGPVVGTVARLHPAKDVVQLVHALTRLEGWRGVIIGDGPGRGEIERAMVELDLDGRLVLAGRRNDVHELLEAFDVFCLCSLWEGSPSALVEAMAAARPVVATAVGGVPELVTHGHDGLLVAPGDPVALSQAIGEAATRPELGESAARTVRERFGVERMLDAHERLWRELSLR